MTQGFVLCLLSYRVSEMSSPRLLGFLYLFLSPGRALGIIIRCRAGELEITLECLALMPSGRTDRSSEWYETNPRSRPLGRG